MRGIIFGPPNPFTSGLGLSVEDAIVIQNSNRLAVRLVPCDVPARVAAPVRRNHEVAAFELEMARRFKEADSPVAVASLGWSPAARCGRAALHGSSR